MTVTAMPTSTSEDGPEKPKRKRLVLVLAVVVVVAVAAAYLLVLKPKGDGAPKPGPVLALDEQTVNLAGGHYLKVRISLQLTKSAPTDVDGSKAQNDVIDLFSGQDVAQLDTGKVREDLQQKLRTTLITDYKGDVMDVYLTEFVTT